MNNESNNTGKFFDVIRPGKNPPSPTSRSIIASKQLPQNDPMVNSEPVDSIEKEPKPSIKADIKVEQPKVELTETPPVSVSTDDKLKVSPTPSEPAVIATPTATDRVVVSHHQNHSKKKPLILIIGILIIVVFIVDLLLDAGLIKTTTLSVPHTHFFNR